MKSDTKATTESVSQNPSSSDRSFSVSSTNSGASVTSADSIIFTSPFEDTSGLDVFAQIAASACPLPVAVSEKPQTQTEPIKSQIQPPVPIHQQIQQQPQITRRASESTSIVHQSQSQLAQTIYQNQQALRMQQQKRESVDSNFGHFNRSIDDSDEDYDEDFDSESENGDVRMTTTTTSAPRIAIDNSYGNINNNIRNAMNTLKSSSSSSNLLLETPIKEETESDLQMDIDQSINFQRRRSPSLSVASNETSPQAIYARRLSAPDNGSNYTGSSGGYSTRRVIHNICERKRRENIRDGFDQLQNRLPAHMTNNPKLSKMEILSGAGNLIKEIQGRVSNLAAEVSALTLVVEQMEKKNITDD